MEVPERQIIGQVQHLCLIDFGSPRLLLGPRGNRCLTFPRGNLCLLFWVEVSLTPYQRFNVQSIAWSIFIRHNVGVEGGEFSAFELTRYRRLRI